MSLKMVSLVPNNAPDAEFLSLILDKLGDKIRLSSDTFILDSALSADEILVKLLKEIYLGDEVYVMELSPCWAGYGSAGVNSFLRTRS